MTQRPPRPAEPEHERPGRAWWIGLVAGGAIFAFGLAGLLGDARQTVPGNWLAWVAAAVVLHDAVLVPAALAAGVLLTRVLAPALRAGAQATLTVCATVALISVPVVLAYGRRADNPSLLPHDYGRNLAIVIGVILGVGILLTLVRQARR